MPSSARSTLILVRKTTRERLERVKGESTFDEVVGRLLDASPRLPAPRPKGAGAPAREPADRRTPAKQKLLARLARETWLARVNSGELREEGPRLFAWTPREGEAEVIPLEWPERRGFAP